MKPMHLGKFLGLQIDILHGALIGTVSLWFGLATVAILGIKIPPDEAILIGLIATFLHWASDLIHQLGHYLASKRTGYPMTGIRFGMFGILASSRYPDKEPPLPPAVHIRRALGGPIASGLLSFLFFIMLPFWEGNWFWLGVFALFENIFVFTLQVFFPLGFNDGDTILKYLRRGTK